VLAPNPGPMTGTGTNTYLVAAAGSVAVVDPGPDDAAHLQAVVDAASELGRISAVIVTHRHEDHLPGARPLCERTGAPLLGHPELPGVDRGLQDDDVAFGGLRALHTPGHTSESVCLWERSQGALFTGDLVAGAGTVVVDDQPGALAQYVGSLERLLALSPRMIYPGHGPLVEDACGKLREYLEHRREREAQIVAALAHVSSVDELVAAVYVGLQPGLAPMAARNVRAHLDKLAAEGRVHEQAGLWQLLT
jgi:glyoxylase-like metal-dependent hydrolase (beta-lactamase superfamily II)